MPFDGIVTHAAVTELNALIAGARVEKVFQTERDEIVLLCHAASEHYRLLISANAANPRLHLTRSKKENPVIAPPFAMVLRKYIQSGRLLSVSQEGYDRIVTLRFETRNEMGDPEEKRLIVEIMGKYSNIILTNAQGVIHDAIKHVDDEVSRVREIMPARPYVFPPAQDKLSPESVTEHALAERLSLLSPEKGTAAALLTCLSGFSPLLCEAVCERGSVAPKKTIGALSVAERRDLYAALETVCAEIRAERFEPAILTDGKDFHCVSAVCALRGISRKFSTVNLMLDEFYTERDRQERLRQKRAAVEKTVHTALEHCRKKILLHRDTLRENAAFAELKKYGDLLNASLYALPEYAREAVVQDYYEPGQPTVTIPLDETQSVSRNAQRYYQKYRKAKTSYESTEKLYQNDLTELDYLDNVAALLENAEDEHVIAEIGQELREEGYGKGGRNTAKNTVSPPDQPQSAFFGGKPASKKSLRAAKAKARASGKGKTPKAEKSGMSEGSKPICFQTPDGFRILVGRNNRQNDRLTMGTAKPEDLWFHLHGAPGSHVILCTAEKNGARSPEAIETAAALAAWYSSARGTSKADVDYTKVKHIKKIPGARPGMVTYTDYRTITVVPHDGGNPVS